MSSRKPLLLLVGPVATRSGYGEHSRDIVRSLIELDKWDVKVFGLRWGSCPMNALTVGREQDDIILNRMIGHPQELGRQPDIHIQVTVPNEFQKYGKYNIGITAGIETNLCSPEWLEGINRMDLVIVPSQHSKDVFEQTNYQKRDEQQRVLGNLKCETPIEVVFEGVDRTIYKKIDSVSRQLQDEMNKIDETFLFLYVGHWLSGKLGQDRKDTGMLVKTFLETFKNKSKKPALLLKTSGAGFSIMEKQEILKKISAIKSGIKCKDLPAIYVLNGDLTPEEMNELYNHPKVKAHVTFTKGEGFGRPLLEATMSGKPVIASDWSGQKDFLNKNFSTLLPGKLTQVHPSAIWDKVIIKESKWFTVDYGYASQVLSKLFTDYNKFTADADKQRVINEGRFSFTKMTAVLGELFNVYIPEFAMEMKLDLPELKPVTGLSLEQIELPELKKVEK